MFSGGGGGGGNGGFFSSQTTNSSLSSAKSRDAQPMVPVTVKQINDAVPSTDDKSTYNIDCIDVKHVILVGMAFNKSERVTDVQFVIDDGTVRIGCHRWVNDPVDTNEVEGMEDGAYVRAHGLLKGFQGIKQLQVFAIRPLINYDELSSHFLACIHFHSFNTRRNGVAVSSQAHNPISTVTTHVNGHENSSGNQHGWKGIDKMVIEYLEQPSSVEAFESLESEGLVYSTIDECHYKSTSSSG